MDKKHTQIRSASLRDTASLASLLGQLGYPSTSARVRLQIKAHRSNGYKIFISEEAGQVTGFIALHWYTAIHLPGPVGRITAFCTDEKVRSRGIGTTLLHYAEQFLKAKQCYKIEVTSNRRRKETHRYYIRQGYIQTSEHFIKYLKR